MEQEVSSHEAGRISPCQRAPLDSSPQQFGLVTTRGSDDDIPRSSFGSMTSIRESKPRNEWDALASSYIKS